MSEDNSKNGDPNGSASTDARLSILERDWHRMKVYGGAVAVALAVAIGYGFHDISSQISKAGLEQIESAAEQATALLGQIQAYEQAAKLASDDLKTRPIPKGTVAFFNLEKCPDRWVAYEGAEGRYVVGTREGETPGGEVGVALTPGENRTVGKHFHTWMGSRGTHAEVFGPGDPNRFGAKDKPNDTTAHAGTVEGTNAPYVQLLACQRTDQ